MTVASFFAAFRNGNLSHSFAHLQYDHNCDGTLVTSRARVLADMEVLGLCDIFRFVQYDTVLCLLALRQSQEIEWSHCDGSDPTFSGYEFRMLQVCDVPPIRANKMFETSFGIILNVPDYEV